MIDRGDLVHVLGIDADVYTFVLSEAVEDEIKTIDINNPDFSGENWDSLDACTLITDIFRPYGPDEQSIFVPFSPDL